MVCAQYSEGERNVNIVGGGDKIRSLGVEGGKKQLFKPLVRGGSGRWNSEGDGRRGLSNKNTTFCVFLTDINFGS